MRRVLVALLCTSSAFAAPEKKDKTIDAKANAAKLDVWKDDLGQFYVVPTDTAMSLSDAADWVFFGDGKNMYRQRIIGSGQDKGKFEWTLWSPRVNTVSHATLATGKDEHLVLECGDKDRRTLTQLKADEAKALFAKATFYPAFWQRQARLLARDDDGIYYFVDQLGADYGGKGYRVFVGQKGQMKEVAMTNVVEDSGGSIYATKSGNLKIVSKTTEEGYWIKNGKKVELTILEPGDNRYLIYRGLGIYGNLGTVCEDL
jgi:hypothetical protein